MLSPLIGHLHVRSTGQQASGLEQAYGLAKLGAAKPARYRMFVMYGVRWASPSRRGTAMQMPDWRIGCIFTGSGHRRSGVARAALGAALAAIHDAGGGLIEAYPEQVEGRPPQRGAYFHTGPADLFEEFGFEPDRKIAKWRWVMRLRIRS
jgi:hypothetical protein